MDKDILIYLMDPSSALVPANMVDRGSNADRLEAFKDLLTDRHTVSFFTSEDDLIQKLRQDFNRLLSTRGDAEALEVNEFASAAELLNRFLLVPKEISGKQLRLRLNRRAKPYSASKAFCAAFNLEYGYTVGVAVEIEQPTGFADSGLSRLYASGKRVEAFLRVVADDSFEVYATPLFSPDEITHTEARFKSESFVYVDSGYYDDDDPMIRRVYEKAEGTIALLFTTQIEAA